MEEESYPKLLFDFDYNERVASEARDRGSLGGTHVQLSDGSRHPVFFYDGECIPQELAALSRWNRPFIAEKGLIVLDEITLDKMLFAVRVLAKEGFFGNQDTDGQKR